MNEPNRSVFEVTNITQIGESDHGRGGRFQVHALVTLDNLPDHTIDELVMQREASIAGITMLSSQCGRTALRKPTMTTVLETTKSEHDIVEWHDSFGMALVLGTKFDTKLSDSELEDIAAAMVATQAHSETVKKLSRALEDHERLLTALIDGPYYQPDEIALIAERDLTLTKIKILDKIGPTLRGYAPVLVAARARKVDRLLGSVPCELTVFCYDDVGIVNLILSVLADDCYRVDIVSLSSCHYPAPQFGTPLFVVEMKLDVPKSTSLCSLQAALHKLAGARGWDLELQRKSPVK